MITIRRLLLFSCLALLGGCATPCSAPNEGSYTGKYCHSRFEITKIDVDNYLVQGVIPDQVFIEGGATVPKSKKTFTFRVRDLDKLKDQIKQGGIYDFGSQEDSPYVELLPDRKLLLPSEIQ